MLQGAKLRIIVLLTLLLIAILLASAILLLLNSSGALSDGIEESGAVNQSHSANELRGPFGEITDKTTTASETSDTTKGTTATQRATRPTTPPPPLEEIVTPSVAVQFATECGVEMTVAERNTRCPGPVKVNRDYAANALSAVLNVTRAVEYTLNVTVEDKADRKMSGSADYLVKIRRKTSGVLLHAGKHILFVDESAIYAWRCGGGDMADDDAEGSRPICIESVSRVPDRELLVVQFAGTVPRGALVRLRLARFEADLTPSNPGLILQHPSSWERDRAWMIGTLNAGRAITSVFPILSTGSGVEKATFRVCIRHPRDVIARSNMPLQRDATDENKLTLSCFRDTAAIPVQHFAFVLFDNLRAVGAIGAESDDAAAAVPPVSVGTAIEVFVGKHLSAADARWIVEETEQALSKMKSALGVHFPLNKLTIVSSPLSALDGTAALGLIHVRETWVEYPKYFHTHSVLVEQLARQWLSNMVTFCDKCFEDGVVTYFEWTISAELSNRMSNNDDGSANLTKRFSELHARLMNGGTAAGGGATAGGVPAAMSPPVAFGGVKPAVECANRVTATLHMLAKLYGEPALHKFLSAVVRQHSWQECVSRAELSAHFRDAVGGHSGQTAQQIFDTFFTDAGGVVSVAPLVRVHLRNGVLTLRQAAVATFSTATSQSTRVVPVEIVDDARRHTQFVVGAAVPVVDADRGAAKFVVAVPNGYVRHIYNMENYERLADCFTTGCASASAETLLNAFGDLCHALLNDRLPATNASSGASGDDAPPPVTPAAWKAVFGSLASRGVAATLIRDRDCLCCMQNAQQPHLAARSQCRWTWRDKCARLAVMAN